MMGITEKLINQQIMEFFRVVLVSQWFTIRLRLAVLYQYISYLVFYMKQVILEMQDMAGGLRRRGDIFSLAL